jgi:hypothetical protein
VALLSKSIGGDARESEICLGIAGIFLKCFMKEIGRIGLVEALVQQQAPAHFVKCLAVGWLCGETELLIRAIPFLKAPEAFGA